MRPFLFPTWELATATRLHAVLQVSEKTLEGARVTCNGAEEGVEAMESMMVLEGFGRVHAELQG